MADSLQMTFEKNNFVESFKKITQKMFIFLLVMVMVMQKMGQTITSTYDDDPIDQNISTV